MLSLIQTTDLKNSKDDIYREGISRAINNMVLAICGPDDNDFIQRVNKIILNAKLNGYNRRNLHSIKKNKNDKYCATNDPKDSIFINVFHPALTLLNGPKKVRQYKDKLSSGEQHFKDMGLKTVMQILKEKLNGVELTQYPVCKADSKGMRIYDRTVIEMQWK